MAGDLRGFALEKAELLSSRLKEIVSAGQGYVRAQFGVDLGLKPELYPTWVILSTAAVALLLLLRLSWAAVSVFYINIPFISACQKVQTPAQVKKNKKKTKTDVKPVQHVSSTDGKEPDDGAWETKVSNQRKRQQRRKDKGPDDSGSPGGVEAPKSPVATPVATAPTNTKKNRGTHGIYVARINYCCNSVPLVTSSWREETSVSGGWTDISLKLPGQISAMEGTKWSTISTAPHYRAPDKVSDTSDRELGHSGGLGVEPLSDWNAPTEHWGNYEDPPVIVTQAPPLKDLPAPNKVLLSKPQCDYLYCIHLLNYLESDFQKKKSKFDCFCYGRYQKMIKIVRIPLGEQPNPRRGRKRRRKQKRRLHLSLRQEKSKCQINIFYKTLNFFLFSFTFCNVLAEKPEQIMEPPKPNQKKKVRRET
uniref:Metadherin a n=1 Tax=Mastacembelus armatus TaxID=205130 RepID=A0A7N8XA14_9TELE